MKLLKLSMMQKTVGHNFEEQTVYMISNYLSKTST
jgi:hypothetical protein